MKKLLAAAAALFFSGCAATSDYSGSVDANVRDYKSLVQAGAVKRVDYTCNFEKIAAGDMQNFGDYCLKAQNSDYVSYFVSFDVQSADIYNDHLVQTVNAASQGDIPGQLKYYQAFSDYDYEKLLKYDIKSEGPTSAALKNGDKYQLILSKKDLLARITVFPELSILSIKPRDGIDTPVTISDYEVKYRIAPYVFTTDYSAAETARLLGLPGYYELSGRLDSDNKALLDEYSTALDRYWKEPSNYDPKAITVKDYAIPQLMKGKSGLPSELSLSVEPPLAGEGLYNDYLPAYELEKISIVYTDGAGEKLLRTLSRDEIVRLIISYEDDALIYPIDGDKEAIAIRFTHKAQPPRAQGLSKITSGYLGLGYIYSDMAATIETTLYIGRFYGLEKLPRACVNQEEFTKAYIRKGGSREEAEAVLKRLDQSPMAKCTPAQTSIAELLHIIAD